MNPLAKRRHFGHVIGPDVSKLDRTVPTFTGKNQERAKLSQASSQTLRELITDGRLESDACSLLKRTDFLFGDSIYEDAEVMLDGRYKWLRRLGERRFFLPNMKKIFSLSFIQLIELELANRKYRISKLYNRQCKVLNATIIASDYTGRDP